MSFSIHWIRNIDEPEKIERETLDITWHSSDSLNNENLYYAPPTTSSASKCNSEIVLKNTILTTNSNGNINNKSDNIIVPKGETSPIIKNKKLIKRKRKKFKVKRKILDSVSSTLTNSMSDSDNLNNLSQNTPIIIDAEKTEAFEATLCIQTFPSQCGNRLNDEWSSEEQIDKIFSKPMQLKKRKRQTQGLARQLQNVLNLKKARINFWNYGQIEDKVIKDKCIVIFIKKQWEEYGHNLYECECNNAGREENVIVINIKNTHMLKDNQLYKLFTPFSSSHILFDGLKLKCIYNVIKYTMIK